MSPAVSMPLSQVMRHPLIALHTYETVSFALDAAREHRVHHFPVCADNQVVGMVCTCDLQEAKLEQPVGDVMRRAVTMSNERSTADAAVLMKTADVGSVLITDGHGSPCGIVTRGDLNGEPRVDAILKDCHCEACGSTQHLQRYGKRRLCFSCRERATEPEAFETGGGD